MWARSVCVNHGLELGSVLPLLRYAQEKGYSAIVLNPNMSHDPLTKSPIDCSASMTRHCRYVWETLIRKSPAKSTAMIAHSAGGMCAANLIDKYTKEFFTRCEALVFTDAGYHSVYSSPNVDRDMIKRLTEIGIHYKAYRHDHKEVGEVFAKQFGPILEVSAGTSDHVLTTGISTPAIISFLNNALKL